jgi:AcrR family transcriptional regulator
VTGASPTPKRRPGRPATLSREQVVNTAAAIAREHGLAAVSTSAVASRLGVSPMALYRHVRDKRELLDQLATLALSDIAVPDRSGGDPLAALAEFGHRLRAALLRYPGLSAYALTRGPVWPSALELSEWCLATLRDAGYDADDAVRAYVAFSTLVIASTDQDTPTVTSGPSVRDQRRASLQDRLASITDAALSFPHLTQSVPALTTLSAEQHFGYALERLLDGFRIELEARKRPRRR